MSLGHCQSGCEGLTRCLREIRGEKNQTNLWHRFHPFVKSPQRNSAIRAPERLFLSDSLRRAPNGEAVGSLFGYPTLPNGHSFAVIKVASVEFPDAAARVPNFRHLRKLSAEILPGLRSPK